MNVIDTLTTFGEHVVGRIVGTKLKLAIDGGAEFDALDIGTATDVTFNENLNGAWEVAVTIPPVSPSTVPLIQRYISYRRGKDWTVTTV